MGSTGGSTESVISGRVVSSVPVPVVVKMLCHLSDRLFPSRSSISLLITTVYRALPLRLLVIPSFTRQMATVFPLISAKVILPGTRLSELSKTLKVPPSPVVIEDSRINSLKKAVTAVSGCMPVAFGTGST